MTSPYIDAPTIPEGQTIAEYRKARGRRRKADREARRRQQSRVARTVVSGVIVLSAAFAAHEARPPAAVVIQMRVPQPPQEKRLEDVTP